MCEAIKARTNFACGNTQVIISDGGNYVKVYLHGNLIYINCMESGRAKFSLAGWNTSTTRSRLRAIGIDVRTKNYMPYYNGKQIDEKEFYTVY